MKAAEASLRQVLLVARLEPTGPHFQVALQSRLARVTHSSGTCCPFDVQATKPLCLGELLRERGHPPARRPMPAEIRG